MKPLYKWCLTTLFIACFSHSANAQAYVPLEPEDTRAVESRYYGSDLDGAEYVPGEDGTDAAEHAARDLHIFPAEYPDVTDSYDDAGDIERRGYFYPASGLAADADEGMVDDYTDLLPDWLVTDPTPDRYRDEGLIDFDDRPLTVQEAEQLDNTDVDDLSPVLIDSDTDLDTTTELDQEPDEDITPETGFDEITEPSDDSQDDRPVTRKERATPKVELDVAIE